MTDDLSDLDLSVTADLSETSDTPDQTSAEEDLDLDGLDLAFDDLGGESQEEGFDFDQDDISSLDGFNFGDEDESSRLGKDDLGAVAASEFDLDGIDLEEGFNVIDQTSEEEELSLDDGIEDGEEDSDNLDELDNFMVDSGAEDSWVDGAPDDLGTESWGAEGFVGDSSLDDDDGLMEEDPKLNPPSAAFDLSMANLGDGEPEEEVSNLLLEDSLGDDSLFGEDDSELSLEAIETESNFSGLEELNIQDDDFNLDGIESKDPEDGGDLDDQLDQLDEDPLLDLGDGPIADLDDFPEPEAEFSLDEDFDGSEEDNWVDQPLELDDSIASSSMAEDGDESFELPGTMTAETMAREDLDPELSNVDAIQEVTIDPSTADEWGDSLFDDLDGQDSDLGKDLAMAGTDNDDFGEFNFSPEEEIEAFSELPSKAIAEPAAELPQESQDSLDLSMDDLDNDLNFEEEETVNLLGTDNDSILGEDDDDDDDPQMDLLAGGLGFDENLLIPPTDDARRASVNTDIDLLEEEDTVLTDTSLSSTRNQFGEAMDLINENPFDQPVVDPDQSAYEDLSHWDDWSLDDEESIVEQTTENEGLDDLDGAFDTWDEQDDPFEGDSLPSKEELLGQEDFDLGAAESLALEGMDSGELDLDQDDDLLSLGVVNESSDDPIAGHNDIFDLSTNENNDIEASVLENINNLDFSLEDEALFEEEELEEMFSDVSGDLSLSSSLEQFDDDDDSVSNLNLDDDDLFKGMAVVKQMEKKPKNSDNDS
jgi:hypothetical protein